MGPVLAGPLTYAGATGSLIDGAGLFPSSAYVATGGDQPRGRRHLDRDGGPAFHRQLDSTVRARPTLIHPARVAADLEILTDRFGTEREPILAW